jgi:hypothetical protein
MYQTITALKALLTSRHLVVPKNSGRDGLLRIAREHDLITEREFLATRNIKDTRKAWLVAELTKLGCTLRNDSRLCEMYIQENIGNPHDIAMTMAEMDFLFSHTEYAAIRDEMRSDAESEYEEAFEDYRNDRELGRPQFNEFFDGEEAKPIALSRWLDSQPLTQETLDNPILPQSFKSLCFRNIAQKIKNSWLVKTFGKKRASDNTYVMDRWLNENERILADLEPSNLESIFGSLIRDRIALDVCKEQAEKAIRNWAQHIHTELQNKLVDQILLTIKPHNIRVFDAELLDREFGDILKIEQMQNDNATVFSDFIAEISSEEKAKIFKKKVYNNKYGHWNCQLCNYYGGTNGIIDHSINQHNISSIEEISAIQF